MVRINMEEAKLTNSCRAVVLKYRVAYHWLAHTKAPVWYQGIT